MAILRIDKEPSVPSTPPAGSVRIYPRGADGAERLYFRDSSGNEWPMWTDWANLPASLVPESDATLDVGSVSRRWRSLYLRGDLSMKDGYNIPFGDIGSVFSVQWSHSYIGIGTNVYNDPSGPQLKHLSYGSSAQFLFFNPHQHRVEYHVHEPSSTSPGPGQNVVYTTPRWWVTRDGDMRVLRDAQIVRHLTVDGNTTLGNAHDDSTTVNGTLTLTHYPRAGGYLNGASWGGPVSTLPLVVVYGGAYVSSNVFTVPTNCGGMYRAVMTTMVVKDNAVEHVTMLQVVVGSAVVAQNEVRLSTRQIAVSLVAWQGYVGAGTTIKFAIGQAHGDCYVVGGEAKSQWWIERVA